MNRAQQGLNQNDLCVFIDAISHYFNQITREEADVRPTYLSADHTPVQDYIGLITISGQYQGKIYFSAPGALLRHLLLAQGEARVSEDNLLDQVGEIANTLAGNARRYFGDRFVISVPQTLRASSQVAISSHPFVIPLNWKKYHALLVVDVCGKLPPL
ncbi:MAG: chemotaxis protein CheX [Sulfuriferula sp.]